MSPWFSNQNIQVTVPVGNKIEMYGGIKNLLNFTPPANSIARPFDPFDRQVDFDAQGQVVPTEQNPNALTFDPTYMFAPNQGIRGFFGIGVELKKKGYPLGSLLNWLIILLVQMLLNWHIRQVKYFRNGFINHISLNNIQT